MDAPPNCEAPFLSPTGAHICTHPQSYLHPPGQAGETNLPLGACPPEWPGPGRPSAAWGLGVGCLRPGCPSSHTPPLAGGCSLACQSAPPPPPPHQNCLPTEAALLLLNFCPWSCCVPAVPHTPASLTQPENPLLCSSKLETATLWPRGQGFGRKVSSGSEMPVRSMQG